MSAATARKEAKALGARIKKFREDNGMAMQTFCKKSKISSYTIYRIEGGKAPSIFQGTVDKIIKVIDGSSRKPSIAGEFACSEAGCEYVGKNERSLKIHTSRSHASRPAKKKTRRRQAPAQVSSEIDEALNLDTTSSATPPLKLALGKYNITVEVTD